MQVRLRINGTISRDDINDNGTSAMNPEEKDEKHSRLGFVVI